MSSVHCLELGEERCIVNWRKYFPNVTQLIFKAIPFQEINYVSPMVLRQMLPLERIMELHAHLSNRYFHGFLQLLIALPNLQKVNLHRTGLQKDTELLQADGAVLATSTKNQSKHVTLSLQQCAFANMKLLVDLFPQMRHLTVNMGDDALFEIVRYLLDKNNTKSRHLNSIYLQSMRAFTLAKITAEVQSEKVRRIDMVKEGHEIRLWW